MTNVEAQTIQGPITVDHIFQEVAQWCDPSFIEPHIKNGMTHMIADFNEKNMPPGTVSEFLSSCIYDAVGAAKICETLREHPEILEKPLEKPLFITGLSRTGTTYLHRLLAQDPNSRALLTWEASQPTPPPTPETHDTDPRIAAFQSFMGEMAPSSKLDSVHYVAATEPEECTLLLKFQFHSTVYLPRYNLTNFRNWLLSTDMKPVYQFHKKILQLLAWKFPQRRWVLKAPSHVLFYDSLLNAFPDACMIQTHRDLKEMTPSALSLASKLNATRGGLDPKELGKNALTAYPNVVDRGLTSRKKLPPSHFFDSPYKELMDDPIGLIRRIYTYYNYEYTDEFENKLKEYIANNPKNKHGKHQYSLEQFGLTEEMINQAFKPYIEAYGAYL